MKKRLWLIAAVMIMLFVFSSCMSVSTNIRLEQKNDDFKGTREITVAFDTAIAENNLEHGIEDLDRYIKKYMPDEFDKFERTDKYNPTEYVFTISFSSLEEYERKIEALAGRDVTIVCEYAPSDVFIGSASLSEDFTSLELFDWVDEGIEDAGFSDMINSSAGTSDSDTPESFVDSLTDKGTTVVIGDRTFSVPSGSVNVETGHGDIVKSIAAELLINEDGSCSSLVVFTFGQLETPDLDAVFDYFNAHTPEGASVEQTSNADSTVFSIAFDCADVNELYVANSTIFGSPCSASFNEYSDPERPMAKLTAFDVNLDLSLFSSDGSVNFSYTVNSTGGVPVEVIDLSDGSEAEYAIRGSSAVITGSEDVLSLRIVLESLESSNGIDYNLVMVDKDHFIREIKIYLDAENATATLEQVAAYFKGKNAPSTKVEIVVPEEEASYVAIVIEGSPTDITVAEDILFGAVEGRRLSYERKNEKLLTKLFDIRPDSELVDSFDISALLSITNTNSFVYTFVTEKDKVYESGSENGVSYSDLATKAVALQLSGGVQKLSFKATYLNVLALVFICLMAVLVILVFALVITFVQNRKEEQNRLLALEEQESFALPQPRSNEYEEQRRRAYLPPDFAYNTSDSGEINMNDPYAFGRFESTDSNNGSTMGNIDLFQNDSFETEESVIPMPVPADEFFQHRSEPERQPEVIPMPAPQPEPEKQPEQKSEPEQQAIPMPAPAPAPIHVPVRKASEPKKEDPFFEDYEDRFPMENLPEFVKASNQPDNEEQYSNRDFIDDLKFLGYLDDYKNRTSQKVKVKVKKRSDIQKEW